MTRPPDLSALSADPAPGPLQAWSQRARLTGGRVSPVSGDPAFTLDVPDELPLPVLIAVPHAGRAYPAELVARMRAPELCQLRLEDRHVDHLGAAVAEATGAALLTAHAPRAMLDLNRADSDIDWEMIDGPRLAPLMGAGASGSRAGQGGGMAANHRARSGLGLIPRRMPGYGEIWRSRLPRAELDRRIAEVHQPYHTALERQLRHIRSIWGAALLIDLHSMPPLPQRESGAPVPVMVVGDRFGAACHHALASCALGFFAGEGVEAAHNRPYSGGYVLDRHGDPSSGIHAMQIEVCRSLYLDDDFAQLTSGASAIAALLTQLVMALGRETAALGQARTLLQAAE